MEKYFLNVCRSIWDEDDKIYIDNLETDTEVAIKKENGIAIVVFKPTNSEKDHYYNFDFRLVHAPWMPPTAKARIHCGFLTKLNRVSFAIDKILLQFLEPKTDSEDGNISQIVFTGFSQGGAMAQLAAHRFQTIYSFENIRISCFAYGSPRVGNSAFIKKYNKTVKDSCRVYYGYDPVPSLPPRLLSYKDTKNPIWIQRNGQVSRKERPWWKSFYIVLEWKWNNSTFLETDHGSQILYDVIDNLAS